jgi:hypothetical protein
MSKKVDYVVGKMVSRPYIIEMGAGRLSRWFKCTPEDIIEARKIAREILASGKTKGYSKTQIPNILILDIETAPLKAYVWRLWKQDISLDAIVCDWFMLSWSAKWLFDTITVSDRLVGQEAVKEDDSRLVKGLWEMLDRADIVVAHNGNSFDIPKINARFIKWGLPPTSPYQQIDTKLIAQKQFGFSSNKLDGLAKLFDMPGKTPTGFQLWVDCVNGSEEAIIKMETYNRNDVAVLEEIYLRLRPWIKGHANLGLYTDGTKPVCPNCGSENVREDGNYYYTPAGRYKTLRCECGAVSRARYTDLDKDERVNLLVGVAR